MNVLLRALRRAAKSFEAKRDKDEYTWFFHVQIEEDELDGGYVVECLEFPGCVSEGETEEEALANIVDAISGVLTARMQASLRDRLLKSGSTKIPMATPEGGAERRRSKIAIGV